MNGADALVESLKREGVEVIFGISGGAALPIYDALTKENASSIRNILTRHEQGAAHMAEGFAKASGKVGVCLAPPFCDPEAADDFMLDIVEDAFQRARERPSPDLLNALFETVRGLLLDEGSLYGWPKSNFFEKLYEQWGVRNLLFVIPQALILHRLVLQIFAGHQLQPMGIVKAGE